MWVVVANDGIRNAPTFISEKEAVCSGLGPNNPDLALTTIPTEDISMKFTKTTKHSKRMGTLQEATTPLMSESM